MNNYIIRIGTYYSTKWKLMIKKKKSKEISYLKN